MAWWNGWKSRSRPELHKSTTNRSAPCPSILNPVLVKFTTNKYSAGNEINAPVSWGEPMSKSKMDRRSFLQSTALAGSTVSWLLDAKTWALPVPAASRSAVKATELAGKVRMEGTEYTLEWSPKNDRFILRDKQGKVMTAGTMQPAVTVTTGSGSRAPTCNSGKVASYKAT